MYVMSLSNNKASNNINKASFNVLIINSSGNSGKTSAGRGLILPRLDSPTYCKVDFSKRYLRRGESFFHANRLSDVHRILMQSCSTIVEVGVSACEQTINKMIEMEGCHDDYDYVLVPVINTSPKLIADSIRTIKILISMGVPSYKIKVLFNKADDNNAYFEPLIKTLEEFKIPYHLEAQIYSYKYYDALDALEIDYNDVTETKLQDDMKYLKFLKDRASKYGLTTEESQRFDFLVDAVQAQRLVLSYRKQEDKVFDILFGNHHYERVA